MRRRILPTVAVLGLLLGTLVLIGGAPPAVAAPGPEPLITFYVPLPEDDYMEVLRSIDAGNGSRPGTQARTTISITAASAGGVVYYDHWENGYEATINDPTQTAGAGRTLVWGDGDTSNGDVTPLCPRCSGDLIPAGGVITLNNSRLPDGTGTFNPVIPGPAGPPVGIPTPRNPANVFWDGRDKIAATRGLTVANIGWGEANALASGAVAVLDTNRWGYRYVVPVGENTPNPATGVVDGGRPTEYTAVVAMARFNGTNVQIDGNNDGDLLDPVDRNVTLNEGQSVFVDGGILQGATIRANQPIQADLFIGDIDASYEVSFIELIPTNGFNTDYIAPAATYSADQATVVFLYNPGTSALSVTRTTPSGTTTISVPAGGTTFSVLNAPVGGAARFTAPAPFFAAGVVGAVSASSSAAYDWGYALLPTSYLTPSVTVGWAPGSQDLSDPDASAVWVTSVVNTSVYVDFDGNPATGANVLPNTGVCNGVDRYDTTVTVTALSSVRIVDTDGDMTGARITTCDLNVKIAVAYGEDPSNAPAGFPGLDLGTAQFPAPGMLVTKAAALVIDLNGDGNVDAGDVVEWTATLADISSTALSNVVATDILPPDLFYVPGSTTIDSGGGPTPVPDDGVPPAATLFPLDESGLLLGSISPGGKLVLRYRTTVGPIAVGTFYTDNIICANADQAADCNTGTVPLDSPAIISDRVWADTNANGIQDGGELGVAGVTVRLFLDANADGIPDSGSPQQTTTTNGSGNYSFTVDPSFNYVVEFVRPSGQYFTSTSGGSAVASGTDSDANRTTGRTSTIDPAPGQVITSVDAGLIPAASIGDRVWEDTNVNGVQDGGEPGVAGVTVRLFLDANADGVPDSGTPLATTTTNGSGNYVFGDLDPNVNYVVEFVLPGGRSFSPVTNSSATASGTDSDANVTTGRTSTINPAPGEVVTSVDAGVSPVRFTITKTSNAGADGTPTVLPGDPLTYTITVTNTGNGDLTNVVVTDTLPAGLTWNATSVTRPTDQNAPSITENFATGDYTGGTGWTGNWTEIGESDGPTAGAVRVVSQQGRLGTNTSVPVGRGISRSIGNASAFYRGTITLDRRCSSFDDANDAVQLQVAPDGSSWTTLRTWAGGTGTCNSTSMVTETLNLTQSMLGPNTVFRFVVSQALESSDLFFFDNITVVRVERVSEVVSAINPLSFTQPLLRPGESMTVTIDTTVDDPLSTSITSITNTACAQPGTPTGIAQACSSVTDPVAPGVISDFVWDDHNRNGIQDAGEPGVPGVTVELYDSTGTTLLATTTTNGAGLYSFTRPAGTYVVKFIAPANKAFTLQDQGANDNIDSDANTTTGLTDPVTVAAGQTITNVDAGLVGTGSIGDTIYWDLNGNSSFDAGEGLAGVTVTIVWAGPDGDLSTAGDNVTYTTTTDSAGQYLFDRLFPGLYQVTVTTGSGPINALGLSNTVDPDGGNDSTSQLTLAPGGVNLLQDFGYAGAGSIGDRIWFDVDGDGVQDVGEPGVAGVGVTVEWAGPDGDLSTTGDNATYTTTTDASGNYLVSGLPAGNFRVTVDTSGPLASLGLASNTGDPDGGGDSTSLLSLTTGQSNLSQDFGYRGTGSIGDTIFNDLNANNAFDTGEGLAGVTVTVVWAGPDGDLSTTGDNVTFTTATDASGNYLVSGLPAGLFRVDVTTTSGPIFTLGLSNTVDPDGGNDSTSQLTLTTGQSNLVQDFGYRLDNRPPVPGDDTGSTACANTTFTIDLLGNDTDPDNDTLSIQSVSATAAGGTVVINGGSVDYTPPTNFTGVDVFTYTVADGRGGTAVGNVTVIIHSDCLIPNDRMYYFGLGGTTGPGTGPGTYDQRVSASPLNLAAQQLVIRLRDGFMPTPGDTFDIWTGPSFTGAFAQIYGQVAPNGVAFEVQVQPNRVRLVAVQAMMVNTTLDGVDTNPGDGVCVTAAGTCTLRAAVQEANALPGTQAIVGRASSTMTLGIPGRNEDDAATGDIDVLGDTLLIGQGSTIDAAGIDRALEFGGGARITADKLTIRGGDPDTGPGGGFAVAVATVTLIDVTIRNNVGSGMVVAHDASVTAIRGRITANSGFFGGGVQVHDGVATFVGTVIEGNTASHGGGLSVTGGSIASLTDTIVRTNASNIGGGVYIGSGAVVHMTRTSLSGNQATMADGGGVAVNGGTANLTDSRVTGNQAPAGGGISSIGHLNLLRVTVDNNTAVNEGGAIFLMGGNASIATSTLSANAAADGAAIASNASMVSLQSVTIAPNTAPGGFAIALVSSALQVRNSIIVGATGGQACSGTGITSLGYNHATDATCGLTAVADVQSGSPNLGALANNGGFSPTHRPLTGSPVINSGQPTGCGPNDQRGFLRPRGGACEKGAIEL